MFSYRAHTFVMVLLGVFIAASASVAEENDGKCNYGFSSFRIDQDLFLEYTPLPKGLNEDRDYTMGLELAFHSCPGTFNPLSFFTPQRFLLKVLGVDDTEKTGHLTSLGIAAFTPDALNVVAPITTDRPYASILYLTNTLTAPASDNNSAFEASFTVGMLGLSITKTFQTDFHRRFREKTGLAQPYKPLGWHNQISNGGEPTAKVGLALYKRPELNVKWLDFVYSLEASLGYNTSASVGFVTKVGLLNNTKPVEHVVRQGGAQNSGRDTDRINSDFEFYVFGGNRINIVGYNALLQSQFKNNPHDISAAQLKNIVYEHTVGFGLDYTFTIKNPRRHAFIGFCTWRSSEHYLATQRYHSWCGINYSFGF